MLGKHEGGNERYIKNLAFYLIKDNQKKHFIKIVVQNDYFSSQNIFSKDNLLKINYYNDFYRIFYFLPTKLRIKKYDIIHSTYIAPYSGSSNSVVTVHDLSFKRYPNFYSFKERVIFNYLLPNSLLKAKAIIVPSRFTQNEFLEFFPQYKNRVFIVYEGADKCFYKISKNIAKNKILRKYGVDGPFLLVINSKNPKKNVDIVIRAYKKMALWQPKLKLVIIGEKDNLITKKYDNIYFFNNIPDFDLNLFYNGCEIFINSSIYEGFNLSIIEALKTKTIVMAADIAVNRELYENSIIYFNPHNAHEIEKIALKTINRLSITGKMMMKQYKKIAYKFDWQKNTQKMLEIYQRVNKK